MSSIGRGRGWGKNPIENPGTLRKPGNPLPPAQSSNSENTDDMIQKIEALNINDTSDISSISFFEPLKTSPVNDETDIQVNNVVKKTLEDRDFAVKFIFAIRHNFTSRILSYIQPLFEGRQELSRPQFLNLTYLLSQMYHQVRTSYNSPITAIEHPLIDCFEELLKSSVDEEIKLAATQISINGRIIHSRSASYFNTLMITVRRLLIGHQLSSQSRGFLMLVIDLYHQEFMPLSGQLQKFYAEILGSETLLEMQSNFKNLWIIIDSQSKCVTAENKTSEGILMKFLTNQKSPPKNSLKDISIQNNFRKLNNSGPRAIRGCGAVKDKSFQGGDRKFFDKKDKTNDSTWSNWNDGNNKSWNHDDRFSKDY